MCDVTYMANTNFQAAIAGFISSTATSVFFPLETIKVHLMVADGRSQNHSPQFKGSMQVLKALYKKGGVARLYRGWYLTTANSFAWSIYFYLYQWGKTTVPNALGPNHHELTKFLTAFQASICTTLIVNPPMVMKTRIMLLKYPQRWYQDMYDSAQKIWKLEGIRGFYSGLGPALCLSLNGTLHLYFYETLKEHFNSEGDNQKTTLIGAVSKLLSSALLHPVQTIKFRLQQEQHSSYILTPSKQIRTLSLPDKPLFGGVWDCIRSTWRHEGIPGFYKGLVINQIRLFPSNGLFFLVYENVMKGFR